MVITKLYGGIGNQMFQYAAGKRLAYVNNCDLKLDISHYDKMVLPNGLPYRGFDLPIFNLDPVIASEEEIRLFSDRATSVSARIAKRIRQIFSSYTTVIEPHFNFYPEVLRLKGNVYLDGYWQSERYFKDIEDVIRKDFQIKTTLKQDGEKMLRKIKSCNAVCLNIRRQEFASNKYANQFVGLEYIEKAVSMMAGQLNDAHFFIFSDELSWVREHVKIPYTHTIVEEELYGDKFRDCLYLMTACRHFIIPNSTFGWWAAWLGDDSKKIVIAPQKWLSDTSKNTEDVVPVQWIKI